MSSVQVSIRIKCSEPTDNITLHTLELKLNEASLKLALADNQQQPNQSAAILVTTINDLPRVKGLSQDKELQYSIIHLDKQLEAGREYLLGIDFVGNLNDDLAGFYKIKYERQNSSEIT